MVSGEKAHSWAAIYRPSRRPKPEDTRMDDASATPPPVRLTSLAHGGGCGCKIAPGVLQQILSGTPAAAPFANLLVGTETSDDAAV